MKVRFGYWKGKDETDLVKVNHESSFLRLNKGYLGGRNRRPNIIVSEKDVQNNGSGQEF